LAAFETFFFSRLLHYDKEKGGKLFIFFSARDDARTESRGKIILEWVLCLVNIPQLNFLEHKVERKKKGEAEREKGNKIWL
jgi:hypothetical protein